MRTLKHITPYEELAFEKTKYSSLKQIASAILLSAIEDGDVEFLTDDYEEWKYHREKRKKRNEIINEIGYKLEFQSKQDLKDSLFEICGIIVQVKDIPKEILEERRLYETNTLKNLIKIKDYKKETLINIAKLHGWKIGVDYVEPTMFDDDF